MKSSYLTVYISMYLAVCHGGFPYYDYLDKVKNHLPTDYLFKIPLLDSTCNEIRDNYLQVKWTLGCLIQRDKDKNTTVYLAINHLFIKLKHCQEFSKKRCHLTGHLQYVSVTQFREKYSEAYELQDEMQHDYVSCRCPSTSTAVPTTEILVTAFEPSPTSMQATTQGEIGSTSYPSQSTAKTDIPTRRSRDITKAVAVSTHKTEPDRGLLLTTALPFIFMGHKSSEQTTKENTVTGKYCFGTADC
ncbi:uncharacterized protein LOC133122005 isoform X2 [Conger conger]|uniref:uncharacterized protein LOC133122005 isoform X2 n=1 Tax=Conger conger TaxID=82655 RepID=UPI002A5A3D41|nr:uncharacterized protein LOC133122005 isoform X2 [Conger conger]